MRGHAGEGKSEGNTIEESQECWVYKNENNKKKKTFSSSHLTIWSFNEYFSSPYLTLQGAVVSVYVCKESCICNKKKNIPISKYSKGNVSNYLVCCAVGLMLHSSTNSFRIKVHKSMNLYSILCLSVFIDSFSSKFLLFLHLLHVNWKMMMMTLHSIQRGHGRQRSRRRLRTQKGFFFRICWRMNLKKKKNNRKMPADENDVFWKMIEIEMISETFEEINIGLCVLVRVPNERQNQKRMIWLTRRDASQTIFIGN